MVSHKTTSDKTISDEALMLEFQDGSRPAFEQLFARYRAPLFAFFRRRLPTETRAEDLTQDTFLAVLRATERYEPRAPVRTYFYGIAFNLLAAERRKQFRDAPTARPTPESATTSDSTQVLWLRQALAKLELSEREILMLREYEQLSYSEIAELLELPINTVRSRLFRARFALKNLLEAKSPVAADVLSRPTSSASRLSKLGPETAQATGPEPIAELNAAEEEGLS